MCTRYILVTSLQAIETQFGLPPQDIALEHNYSISPGQYVPVPTWDKPHEIQFFRFGSTPFWAKAEMNLYNARAEGDSNPDDNLSFKGATGIILKKPSASQFAPYAAWFLPRPLWQFRQSKASRNHTLFIFANIRTRLPLPESAIPGSILRPATI